VWLLETKVHGQWIMIKRCNILDPWHPASVTLVGSIYWVLSRTSF